MVFLTLTNYLIFGLLLIIALIIFWYKNREYLQPFATIKGNNNKFFKNLSNYLSIYFIFFLIYAGLSIFTLDKYFYPSKTQIFNSADYHALEHLGFEFHNSLDLVNGENRNFALWDQASGHVSVNSEEDSFRINIKDFYTPIYQEIEEKPLHRKFRIINPIIDQAINDSLEFYFEGDTINFLSIKIDEHGLDSATYTITTVSKNNIEPQINRSSFSSHIKQGFSLSEIILQSRLQTPGKILESLQNSYLLRRDLISNSFDKKDYKKHKVKSDLLFFPSYNFLEQPIALKVDGKEIERDSFKNNFKSSLIPPKKRVKFFQGIGVRKKRAFSLEKRSEVSPIRLTYNYPERIPLRGIEENVGASEASYRLYLTSQNKVVSNNVGDGGYLFDKFISEDNIHHIEAYVNYFVGNSKHNLYFRIQDIYNYQRAFEEGTGEVVPANEEFYCQTNAQNNAQLKWIFKISDFRASNPIQPSHIYFTLLIICFLLSIRLLIQLNSDKINLSIYELVIWFLILGFLTVKSFLLWRLNTFPPLDDPTSLNYFRSQFLFGISLHYFWSVFPIILILFIWLIRLDLLSSSSYMSKLIQSKPIQRAHKKISGIRENISNRINPTGYQNEDLGSNTNYPLFHLSMIVLASLLCYFTSARFSSIGIPLIIYFIGNRWVAGLERYPLGKVNWTQLWLDFKNGYIKFALVYLSGVLIFGFLIWRLLKGLWTGNLLNFDNLLIYGGTIFVFLVFAFLNGWILNSNTRLNIVRKSFFKDEIRLVILIKLGVLILPIIWLLIRDTGYGIIFLIFFIYQLIGGALLSSGWFRNDFWSTKIRKKLRNFSIFGFSLLFLGIIFFQNEVIYQVAPKLNKSYIGYRAAILQKPIDSLIVSRRFNSSDINQILNASHNQWFINSYIGDQSFLGNVASYFRKRPHFNQGSSYITQSTDLVISRYIIGEHNELLVILLTFLLLVSGFAFIVSNRNSDQKIYRYQFNTFSLLILLFVTAFFVWMTATNRFTFFGQDFPFISLTSKFSSISFAIIILCGLFGLFQQGQTRSTTEMNLHIKNSLAFLGWILGLSFMVFLITISNQKKAIPEGKLKNEKNYNISKVIDDLSRNLNRLNKEFTKYQSDLENNVGLDNLVDSFFVVNGLDVNEDCESDKPKFNELFENNFLRTAICHFQNSKNINRLDPNEIIHLRIRNGQYKFAVNRRYYFVKGLEEENTSWRGNVLAANVNLKAGLFDVKKERFKRLEDEKEVVKRFLWEENNNLENNLIARCQNLQVFQIPRTWRKDSVPVYLVKVKEHINGGNFIISNDSTSLKFSGKMPAQILQEGDYLNLFDVNGKFLIRYHLIQEKPKFLVHTNWVNGRQSYHYPLGEKFMWSYNLANLLNNYSKYSKDSALFHKNYHLTLDYNLTENVYDKVFSEFDRPLPSVIRSAVKKFIRNFNEKDKSSLFDNEATIFLDTTSTTKIIRVATSIQNSRLKYKLGIANRNIKDAINRYRRRGNPDFEVELNLIKEELEEITKGNIDFSITAINGKGEIVLMVDYDREFKYNPNNINEYYAFLRDAYTESTISLERGIFGTKNLLEIEPGPGSSLKPFTFFATASETRFKWDQIDSVESIRNYNFLENNEANIYRTTLGKDEEDFLYYGGKELEAHYSTFGFYDWRKKSFDNYIQRSSNLINSIVVFLGSFTNEKLMDPYGSIFINPFPDTAGHRNNRNFPILYLGKNGKKIFNPKEWPEYQFQGKSSAIANGFDINFDISTNTNEETYLNDFGEDLDSLFNYFMKTKDNYGIWTFTEKSDFIQSSRSRSNRIGLIQPTLGADPVNITPLKMAEMGTRLVTGRKPIDSQRAGVTTILNGGKKLATTSFNYLDSAQTVNYVKRYIIKGMKKVIASPDGTGFNLNQPLKDLIPEGKELHFFAKTGTINILDRSIRNSRNANINRRGKHLLLLITNQDISANSYDLFSNDPDLRYYSVYISFHSIEAKNFDWVIAEPLIKSIIESETFKSYMFPNEE